MGINKDKIKNCFAALLAAMMLCSCGAGVAFAVEEKTETEEKAETKKENTEDTEENDEEASEDDKEKKEKPRRKKGEMPTLAEGETGILIDSVSGRVLFEKDSDKRMYPASTTKIMTALLAIEAVEREEISLDDSVTITADMLEMSDPDGTTIALKEGETITLDYLLKGLMVASGNDAACAIATYVEGDVMKFVDKMNERAKEIGTKDTHFANPHGLHDDAHYTTAADMAKIAWTAMKLDKFRNIADIVHIKIPPTDLTEKERYYINTNGLLSSMRYLDYYYKGAIGIKTGYTSKAGNCLVSAANRDGLEFIGVLFGGADVKYSHNESIDMLDWGFEQFNTSVAINKEEMVCEIKVKQGKGTDSLTLAAKEGVRVVIPKDVNVDELEIRPELPEAVYAPITAGTEVGGVTVLLNSEELGKGMLVAAKSVERSFFWPVMALGEWIWSMPVVRVIVCVAGVGIIFFIVLFFTAIHKNLKRAKRRRRKPMHKK